MLDVHEIFQTPELFGVAEIELALKSKLAFFAYAKKANVSQSYKRYHVRSDEGRNHIQVVVERSEKKPLIAKCGEQPLMYHPNATYLKDKPLPSSPREGSEN